MTSGSWKKWFSQLWHPSDEDLLAFLDGEAAGRTSRRVQRHLAQCWSCRARREEFDLSISGFLKNRERLLTSLSGDEPEAEDQITKRFQFRLRNAASEADLLTPARGGTPPSARRLHLRLSLPVAASLLAVVCAFYVVIQFNHVPTVSAQEILRRASEEGNRQIAKVAKPVVHRKLRVTRRTPDSVRADAITWESWNDQENRRFVQRVADADQEPSFTNDINKHQPSSGLLAELQTVFRENGYDVEEPLSSKNHERWRQSLKNSSEEVVETALPAGGAALVVKTGAAGPYPAHSIIQAELVVRTGDWHPVEQRLRVQGKERVLDYEIKERTFEVVTLTALPPTLFTAVVPPLPVTTSTRPSSPPAVLSSEAELLAVEIQAHYALHQLKACLGKPVHIRRNTAGRIEVGGLVETAEERDELKAALRTVPGATFEVQTVAEATQAAASGSPASTGARTLSSDTAGVTVRSGRMPLQLQLQQYFSRIDMQSAKADAVASLSNGAVTLSRSIMIEAWALRRLAERYKGNQADSLTPYARILLQNMVQDHVNSVRLGVEKARHLLEPVLSSLFPEEPASRGGLGNLTESGRLWSETCLDLFGRAEEVRGIVDALFAGVETESEPEVMARRLVELLSHWTRQFPSMEVEIARQFSADAKGSVTPDSNASHP